MKLIDRYLLREYMIPVAYCLLAFTMVQLIYDLFHHLSRLLSAGTPASLALLYYVCLLIPTLEYLVPASLFLATLYTLWQLTRHSEIIAMRASGLSLYRIVVPFLGVGILFSLLSMGVKEFVVPPAREWVTEFSHSKYQLPEERLVRDCVYYNSVDHRIWIIESFDKNQPHRLNGVKVTQERKDGSRSKEVRASRAEWLDGEWWMWDVLVQAYDENDNPVGKAVPPVMGTNAPACMREFTGTPDDILISLKNWDFLSSREMTRFLSHKPDLSDQALAQRLYDVHSRHALPWACVIVTLFGVPAGVRGGRQSALTGILLAIMFFFGYYLLTNIGVFLGKQEIVQPWLAAWLSNIVFLVIGAAMVLRMR